MCHFNTCNNKDYIRKHANRVKFNNFEQKNPKKPQLFECKKCKKCYTLSHYSKTVIEAMDCKEKSRENIIKTFLNLLLLVTNNS
jgi:hypothetical protein